MRAKLGLYPQDHPVSLYAQKLQQRVGGFAEEDKPQITVFKGEPNVFVFPNGSVYLSDQFLRLAETEEEIFFALMHERIHFKEAHSEQKFERDRDPEKYFKNIMLGGLGQSRVHEWEGDLRAFTELDKLGINPMGGIDLLEKFRLDPKMSGGLVHGKSTDRALNLRAMTYLKDLVSIEKPLHPIPTEIKSVIEQEQEEGKFTSLYDQLMKQVQEVSFFKSVALIDRMDTNQILVTLERVMDDYLVNRKRSEKKGDRADFHANFQANIIPLLSKKVWENLAQVASTDEKPPSDQQVTFIFYNVLALTLGVETDIHDNSDVLFNNSQSFRVKSRQSGLEVPWEAERFSLGNNIQSPEDIDEFIKTLDPGIFTGIGLKLNADPENLIQNVTQSVMDNFFYEDNGLMIDEFLGFTERISARLEALYQQHGGVEFSPDDVYEKVVEVAKGNLEDKDVRVLMQRVHELKPSVFDAVKETEQKQIVDDEELDKRLVNVFSRFATDYKKTRESTEAKESDKARTFIRGLSMIKRGRPEFDSSEYPEELRQIFQEKQFNNSQELLVFIANFRKTIQEDRELWGTHILTDDVWNPLMEEVISETPASSDFTSTGEKKLFDFKVALLLAHDWTSNNLQEPRQTFGSFLEDGDFDLDWYRRFYALATNDNELSRETGVEITTDSVLGSSKNDDWEDLFKEGKYRLLENELKIASRQEFSRILEELTNDFPFNHFGVERGWWGEDSSLGEVKRRLLNEIFKKYTFDLSNIDDLKDAYYLSTYLEDQTLAIRLQSVTWAELSKRFTFEEGFAFLEKELNAKRLLSLKAVSDFVEHNAKTHDEIELATDNLIGLATKDSSMEGIGKLVVKEELVGEFFLDNKYELLLASIGNGEDDSTLKRYLYKRWVSCMDYERTATIDNVHLNDLMRRLYRLDAQSKYIFIRDLLTGDKGVLTDPDVNKRLDFVNFFLDNYIEVQGDEDAKFFSVIKDVMHEVVRTANYDLLYFAISPILQERMLIQPSNQVSWLDVIRTEEPPRGYEDLAYRNEFDSARNYLDLYEDGEKWGEKIYGDYDEGEQSELPEFDLEERYIRRVDEKDADELLKYITGISEEQKEDIEQNQLRREYEDTVDGMLLAVEEKPAKQKMSVNEFILETAQKLGAPGVRFLQLIGQYVELPPQLEQSFNQVYDKVGGQSKITADQTLLREWPQARDRLAAINERLGGGSLMSVFRTSNSEGKDLALKILNPNSGHHTETTYKLLNTVFTALSEKDAKFAPSMTLLGDIREWIRNDIDFEDFLEQDRKFRRKHDGYSIGGRYKVKVPVSFRPENKFFVQEEFVDGTNLTEIERLQEQGHDLRQVVALVTRNFFEQVKDGQVHSDIHPGNLRVTPNDEVAFLDRNYYLHFGLKDKLFLRGLQGSLGDSARATEMCLDYIQSQGVQIDKESRQRVLEQTRSLSEISDPTNRLLRLAVILRKEDLRFPIKTTLLIKNFFYIDRMAKRVEFSGIAEAAQAK